MLTTDKTDEIDPDEYGSMVSKAIIALACLEAAEEQGHSPDDANQCNDGHLKCPSCPMLNELADS